MAIFEYINGFYNPRRRHSALGWKSPLSADCFAIACRVAVRLRTEGGLNEHLERHKSATGPKPHVRLALALTMIIGLDPSDALRLCKDQVESGTIWGIRGKTGEEVAIPVSPTLQAALDRMPSHDAETVLSNSRGEA